MACNIDRLNKSEIYAIEEWAIREIERNIPYVSFGKGGGDKEARMRFDRALYFIYGNGTDWKYRGPAMFHMKKAIKGVAKVLRLSCRHNDVSLDSALKAITDAIRNIDYYVVPKRGIQGYRRNMTSGWRSPEYYKCTDKGCRNRNRSTGNWRHGSFPPLGDMRTWYADYDYVREEVAIATEEFCAHIEARTNLDKYVKV